MTTPPRYDRAQVIKRRHLINLLLFIVMLPWTLFAFACKVFALALLHDIVRSSRWNTPDVYWLIGAELIFVVWCVSEWHYLGFNPEVLPGDTDTDPEQLGEQAQKPSPSDAHSV